jgi:hypothetical protein
MFTRIALVFAVILGFFAFTAAPAQAALNDANIKNQSYSLTYLSVCKDAISDTQCGSTRGTLNPGQTTHGKYGWTDADGIFCGQGWYCQVFSNTITGSGSGSSTKFVKISGCSGCTVPVYLYPKRN